MLGMKGKNDLRIMSDHDPEVFSFRDGLAVSAIGG